MRIGVNLPKFWPKITAPSLKVQLQISSEKLFKSSEGEASDRCSDFYKWYNSAGDASDMLFRFQ